MLDRTNGTLTVTELDGNSKHKKGESLSVHVWSGNGEYGIGFTGGQGANGLYDNLEDHGPIPSGNYLIGNKYNNPDIAREHPGGDADWYRLYGNDGKGGYSYEHMWNGRGGFNLHTGLRTNGCVTHPSDVSEEAPNYPHSKQFDKVKDVLDATKPLEYNGSTFRGTLHVK